MKFGTHVIFNLPDVSFLSGPRNFRALKLSSDHLERELHSRCGRQLHHPVHSIDDRLATGNAAASIALKMALGESINTPRGMCLP